MIRRVVILVPVILLVAAAAAAWGQELLARPDVPGHEAPENTYPETRPAWEEWLDVAVLAAALSLASYLALVRRSRRGLFALTIISLAWFGFWREGCICPIGSIQNVTEAVADSSYHVPVCVVVFFALPLVFTLFFGRTFCASVCPLGAVQELVAVRPVKTPLWLDHALGLFAYLYLGLAVAFAATGAAYVICEYDPFVGFFRLAGNANMIILGGCFLVVGIFIGRPYCRYLCPYGAVLRVLSKVSKYHLSIPPESCINCRLCEDACPYGAIREPTVEQSPAERASGRWRLVGLIALLPVLIGVGVWLGRHLAVPMSRMHYDVRVAERVSMEELGEVKGTTDASDAFRITGQPAEELYATAESLQKEDFATAGSWFGAWAGLVIGWKLIHLSIRRRRVEYLPDRAGCVSCGRCFWYCPEEQARLGLIKENEEVDQAQLVELADPVK